MLLTLMAWLIGNLLREQGTDAARFWQVARALAFSFSPGVLLVLWFLPVLGGVIWILVNIWFVLAAFVAIREAVGLSGRRALFTLVLAYAVPFSFGALLALTISPDAGLSALQQTLGT